MDIQDKVALITGASRGLGRAVAETMGAAGAQVIAVARTVGGLEEVDDAIRAAGGPGAVLVPLDITDDPGLSRLGAAIHERWGRLDIWVHSAVAAPMLSPAEHIEADQMDLAGAVNVIALQRLIRALDPLLRQSPAGRAVFLDDPIEPDAFNAVYCAGKAGQRVLAEAWGKGIAQTTPARVIHALAPPMPTGLRAKWFPGEDRSSLTPPALVAQRLLCALAGDADGVVDLRE